jgi:hypothetical protein
LLDRVNHRRSPYESGERRKTKKAVGFAGYSDSKLLLGRRGSLEAVREPWYVP